MQTAAVLWAKGMICKSVPLRALDERHLSKLFELLGVPKLLVGATLGRILRRQLKKHNCDRQWFSWLTWKNEGRIHWVSAYCLFHSLYFARLKSCHTRYPWGTNHKEKSFRGWHPFLTGRTIILTSFLRGPFTPREVEESRSFPRLVVWVCRLLVIYSHLWKRFTGTSKR